MIRVMASRCRATKAAIFWAHFMNFFLRIVCSAGIAGLLAAVLLTVLQTTKVYPLILAAEVYENDNAATTGVSQHEHKTNDAAVENHHDEDSWAPADGLERLLFSFFSNALLSVGLALVLVAIFALRGVSNWRHGLIWGIGGFVAVQLAPSLGLPPELPGLPAADIMARQVWWVGTVFATASGLAAIFLTDKYWSRAAGVLLIAVPHIIGAPHPSDIASSVPANLAAEFVSASLATNLVFWVALGLLCAIVLKQFEGPEERSDRTAA